MRVERTMLGEWQLVGEAISDLTLSQGSSQDADQDFQIRFQFEFSAQLIVCENGHCRVSVAMSTPPCAAACT